MAEAEIENDALRFENDDLRLVIDRLQTQLELAERG